MLRFVLVLSLILFASFEFFTLNRLAGRMLFLAEQGTSILHWALIVYAFMAFLSVSCFLVRGGHGVKKAMTLTPIPFCICFAIVPLIGALNKAGSGGNFYEFMFEALVLAAMAFSIAALLTALAVGYRQPEDDQKISIIDLKFLPLIKLFAYSALAASLFSLVRLNDIPWYPSIFNPQIFGLVTAAIFGFYFLSAGIPTLNDLARLRLEWNVVADAALYTSFLMCAFSFFDWMVLLYSYQENFANIDRKLMGDTLAIGWLCLYWSMSYMLLAHIFISLDEKAMDTAQPLKRNWHAIELFGFFIFLTVAPPNLIDLSDSLGF